MSVTPEALPMKEALRFWSDKKVVSAKEFYSLAETQRQRAFAVSGIASMEMMADVHESLYRAIAEGKSLGSWKKEMADTWEKLGWTGKKAWRLDNIFRTNVQTAFSVGRYRQMQRVKKRRPYWRYSAVGDRRTRPTHAALNGKVFHADNPFWDTFYPPNGFSCFPAGTKVLTGCGWRRIETIGIHDRVIGGSGEEKRVTAVHKNPFDGHLRRLVFENGRIDATPNHRILTMRGWIRAENIRKGDILVQAGESTGVNPVVGDIDQAYSQSGNSAVPLPAQGKTAEAFALHSQVQVGKKDVKPTRADIRGYNMIVNHLITKFGQMIQGKFFRLGGRSVTGRVPGDLPFYEPDMGGAHFPADFRSSGRCRFSELIRCTPGAFVNILGFAPTRMVSGCFHLFGKLFHLHGRLPATLTGIVQPLCFDGLGAFPGGDLKMGHQPHEGAGVDVPTGAYLPVRQFVNEVSPREGFTSGAPLNSFDSPDCFRAWARLHGCLQKVIDCQNIPYTGTVFNLSVEEDESYIIPGATVHNCRCTVTTLSERQVKARGIRVERGNPYGGLIEPVDPVTGAKLPARPLVPDRGFSSNPAKEYWAGLTPSEIDAKDVKPLFPAGKTICRQGGGSVFAEGDICRPPLGTLDRRHILPIRKGDIMPKGLPDEEYVKVFLAEFGITDIDGGKVITLPGGVPVVISKHFFIENKATGTGWKVKKNGREQYVKLLARTILNPYEIWRMPKEVSKRPTDTLNLIRLFRDADSQIEGFVVFSLVAGRRWLATSAFVPAGKNKEAVMRYLERQRSNILIYREELK